MGAPQMMVLYQALAKLHVPPPDPGRWTGECADVARQMRAVIGRHRDLVPSSAGFLPGGSRAMLTLGAIALFSAAVAQIPIEREVR
jgi:hypothetical protein